MRFLFRKQKFGAAAILLAASAFLSRLMGLIRDKTISWQFGAGEEADLYFAAFVIPDIINYLLAGAFVSITIIPILAACFEKDDSDGWHFFSCIFFWMSFFAILFTAIAFIFAKPLTAVIAPGFNINQLEKLSFFMRMILPGQIFFLSGSCFTALLLLRKQFAVPALTPLIYNGCIIVFGLLFPLFERYLGWHTAGMSGYCIGVSIGAFLGAFILPLIIAHKGGLQISFNLYHPKIKNFLYMALPLMLGQTVIMLDEQFLRIFGSMLEEGTVSLLNYARRIAQVPVALLGQALAAASYPFLVSLLAKNDTEKFNSTLNVALSSGLTLIIPCAAIMMISAFPILGGIFIGGRFGLEDAIACVPLTRIMLAGTPFWIIYAVMARAFYATGNTLTPAITGTIITLICIPAYYLLALPKGAAGIAFISCAGVAVYSIWLMAIWIYRQGTEPFKNLPGLCFKALFLSLLAATIALAPTQFFHNVLVMPQTFFQMLINGTVHSIIFVVIFLGSGKIFYPEYIKTILNIFMKKH